MGLFKKLKKAFKDAADAVEDFFNDVGDAVGNAVEAAGDAIDDALNWIGSKIGAKPFFSWLGGIIKSAFSVTGAIIKGVFGIVGGIIGGSIKILGGIITLDGSLILEGIGDIFSPIIGTIVLLAGKSIASVQTTVYAQGFERPLSKFEISQLQKVFKKSLNYYVIRIIEGHSGVFGINSRAFTLGNTIYMKTDSFPIDLLVHESTHVWQYQQNGNRYVSDAIYAQWFISDEYNWDKEVQNNHKSEWSQFNKEAQAQFLQDIWKNGELRDINDILIPDKNKDGAFYEADDKNTFGFFVNRDYTKIANNAVKTVRNEWF